MTTEAVEAWLAYRREVASRVCMMPSEEEIREATGWISKPDSNVSSAILPKIIEHAGQGLTADGITQMLIDGYNAAVEEGNLSSFEKTVLMVNLDLYASSLVQDKEVVRMVGQNIHRSIEEAAIKAKLSSPQVP